MYFLSEDVLQAAIFVTASKSLSGVKKGLEQILIIRALNLLRRRPFQESLGKIASLDLRCIDM